MKAEYDAVSDEMVYRLSAKDKYLIDATMAIGVSVLSNSEQDPIPLILWYNEVYCGITQAAMDTIPRERCNTLADSKAYAAKISDITSIFGVEFSGE